MGQRFSYKSHVKECEKCNMVIVMFLIANMMSSFFVCNVVQKTNGFYAMNPGLV